MIRFPCLPSPVISHIHIIECGLPSYKGIHAYLAIFRVASRCLPTFLPLLNDVVCNIDLLPFYLASLKPGYPSQTSRLPSFRDVHACLPISNLPLDIPLLPYLLPNTWDSDTWVLTITQSRLHITASHLPSYEGHVRRA
jgi:hypothetical protein